MIEIDIHGHIFSPYILPKTIFFKRLEIPSKDIIEFYNNNLNLDKFLYSNLASKVIDNLFDNVGDIKHFIDLVAYDLKKSLDLTLYDMKMTGIDKMVLLLLDTYVEYPDYLDKVRKVISEANDKFILFFGFDPRRKNIFNTFKNLYNRKLVQGIKLYPKLGFSPVPSENPSFIDKELRALYSFCEENNIPIITHSSKGGIDGVSEESIESHPGKWGDVLFDFPELKVCLAHSGGNDDFINYWLKGHKNWAYYTHMLIQEFDNVYCDVSFHDSFRESDYWNAFSNLLSDGFMAGRTLWGSDYPLHLVKYSYQELVAKWTENKYIWNLLQGNNRIFLNDAKVSD